MKSNIIKFSFSTFIFILLISCSSHKYICGPSNIQNKMFPSENFKAVIIDSANACHFHEGEAYWTPKNEQIELLEKCLISFLYDMEIDTTFFNYNWAFSQKNNIVLHLKSYKIQYVGYLKNNKKFIFGNAFCHTWNLDWTKQLIQPCDGGSCYWHFVYDVEQGKIISFDVNGVA